MDQISTRDERIKGAHYPICGEQKDFFILLVKLLESLQKCPCKPEDLIVLLPHKMRRISKSTILGRLRMSLCHTGLADVDDHGDLKLTSDGELFLKTKSSRIILKNLESNVWGFREIKEMLSKKPMSLIGISRELRKLGSGWRSNTQPDIRLRFLTILGAVEKVGKKYRWVGIPPSHEEVKHMLTELGSLLGYATSMEYKVGSIRIDVVWQRDTRPESAVIYAFEVHVEGQTKSAIYNLQECIRRWSPRMCYIVTNWKRRAEVEDAIEPLSTLERSKINVLTCDEVENMLSALNDIHNILKKRNIVLNTIVQ